VFFWKKWPAKLFVWMAFVDLLLFIFAFLFLFFDLCFRT